MSFAHIDLEGLVFLVSPSPLALKLSLSLFLWGFLSSEGKDLMKLCVQDLSSCIVLGCGPLTLFLSAPGESFSDDG